MKELTDEALNIAICEWRGWKFDPATGPLNMPWRDTTKPSWDDEDGWIGRAADLPSHITGNEALGNMHEAEKGLTDVQYSSYITGLECLVEDERGERYSYKYAHSATARQRAVALLRVVKPEVFE